MKSITLEDAQTVVNDPQAIARGYITEQSIIDATKLAEAVVQMSIFNQPGYSSPIGSPHQWWYDNCPVYAEISDSPLYSRAKKLSCLLTIANYLVEQTAVRNDVKLRCSQSYGVKTMDSEAAQKELTEKLEGLLESENTARIHLSDVNVELWNEHSDDILEELNSIFYPYVHTAEVDEEDYLTVTATEEDDDDEDDWEEG